MYAGTVRTSIAASMSVPMTIASAIRALPE